MIYESIGRPPPAQKKKKKKEEDAIDPQPLEVIICSVIILYLEENVVAHTAIDLEL